MTTALAEQRDRSLRIANLYRAERHKTKAWIAEPRDTAASRERSSRAAGRTGSALAACCAPPASASSA
jgi:hypothetical protein